MNEEEPAADIVVANSLESDSQGTDGDSALGDERASIRSQSVTSSIYNYRYENGRRFHAYHDGRYPLPNDDQEQDRLDLQHHLFRLALDGNLTLCPIGSNIHNALDVGCGTGIWAIDFADENPAAKVMGVDLSPIQPIDVPPNCSFLVDDCEADWLFDHKFDLIHSRAMIGGFRNWPRFFEQAYENLRPGGYIELQEFHLPACTNKPEFEATSDHVKWTQLVFEAGAKIGLKMDAPGSFHTMLADAGFVDITVKWLNWPCGPWAKGEKNKLIGRWLAADLHDGVATSAAMFTRVLGWKDEEFQVFMAKVRNEMKTGEKHVYHKLCFAYARKPGAPHHETETETDPSHGGPIESSNE